MMRSKASVQKTYDECYMMCSTAIYFEGQNNESEALRSWKDALDAIRYHNSRFPASYVPKNAPEKALQESIRELELQCKERIDLLETLHRSRNETRVGQGEQRGRASSGFRGFFDKDKSKSQGNLAPNGDPLSPGWIGDGTIPSLSYPDLPRPTLPPRPSFMSRSSAESVSPSSRDPVISGPAAAAHTALAASGGKKTLLTTLRSNEPKPSSTSSPRKLTKPEASKAAGLAWGNVSPQSKNSASHSSPGHQSTGLVHRRGPSGEIYPQRDFPTARRRSGDHSGSNLATGAAAAALFRPGETALPLIDFSDVHSDVPPPPYQAAERREPSYYTPSRPTPPKHQTAYPAYRKEYPEPQSASKSSPVVPRVNRAYSGEMPRDDGPSDMAKLPQLFRSASIRKSAGPPRNPGEISGLGMPGPSNENVNRGRAKACAPSGFPFEKSDMKTRSRSSSRSKATPLSNDDSTSGTDEPDTDSDSGFKRLVDRLPKGIDRAAAQNIINEILVRGDEVHWDDIAGLENAKSALKEAVVYPFLRPDLFSGLREPARGMLLFGPPGTGKTMLARAVATESKSTFFSISASSLTSKWHGESEKLVRALFALARSMAPSIIFVDEIDSLLSSRSSNEHDATRRVKTEFLIQWSDLQRAAAGREQQAKDKREGDPTRVLVLGATNMPWDIDEAARRRFVRRQYIPLPESEVRKQQLRKLLSFQNHKLSDSDLEALVSSTNGFSGSDITALAKDAAMGPLRNLGEALLYTPMEQISAICFKDFESSLSSIRPSVSREGLKGYEAWARDFGERGS